MFVWYKDYGFLPRKRCNNCMKINCQTYALQILQATYKLHPEEKKTQQKGVSHFPALFCHTLSTIKLSSTLLISFFSFFINENFTVWNAPWHFNCFLYVIKGDILLQKTFLNLRSLINSSRISLKIIQPNSDNHKAKQLAEFSLI